MLTKADLITILQESAACARAAAETAAEHREIWDGWRHGPGLIAACSAGQPGHPEVPEPGPQTEDVLRRLAEAFDARAKEIDCT